ncbi:MAG: tetratricopeptide repeat protein [Desulfobacterales bacterium]|nr:tetratricopeptide repeat protein [Desulfobacterales bacterium]
MKEKIFCDYHPTQAAQWGCSKCAGHFCGSCITKRAKGYPLVNEFIYLCPKCYRPAAHIGVANLIDPFWTRLHKMFLYPFALHSILLILAASLLGVFFNGPGIFNWTARFILFAVMVKYSFEALRATASGNLRAPKITSETITDNSHMVWKQLVLFFLMGVAVVWVAAQMGALIGILFGVFLFLCLPAIVILLVSTESIIAALNPMIFVPLIIRIGWGYLLMYFFLLLLAGAPAALAYYIIAYIPPVLQLFLVGVAKYYYTIITYHLMGYVILQYHEEIGYEVDFEAFQDPSVQTAAVEESMEKTILKEANLMIQDGKLDEAIDAIQKHAAMNGLTDLELSERYFKLLRMKKRGKELLAHSEPHLELLAKEGMKSRAVDLYLMVMSKKPDFIPGAETLFKLGGWLNETGKSKQAVAALGRLGKEYPDNPLTPKAYFRAAQIVHDRYMNPERAGKMLTALLNKYPDHEIAPKVKKYLTYIQGREGAI